jgi:glycosyltransferase involved in cell wall biosynthesis
LNVLITADQLRRPVPGGIGTYVRSLTRALAARTDIDPKLWTPAPMFRQRFGHDAIADLQVPMISSRVPVRVLTRAWDRDKGKTPSGFAVVHATSTAVPPKSSTPMTVMVHDLGWRSFPDAYPERGRLWHEAALARAIDRAKKIFVPSTTTANDLIADGVKSSRIEVIPLGSDHLPPPDDKRVQSRLRKMKVSPRFFLAVGTMEPRKNLPGLIEAYTQFRDKGFTDIDLVIVGPAGWGDSVKPTDGVKIVPSATLAEVAAFYRHCFAFVSVPFLEGFGLPVLEAMTQGAPVIASPVPSAGDATYRVDPHNVSAIAEAMVRVTKDESLRTDLIERGKRHADRHTWADTARLHAHAWMQLPL